MIRTDLLKGEIARAGFNHTTFAKELGMTPKTFSCKMKKGVFNSNEIDTMIDLLKIENPAKIFFAKVNGVAAKGGNGFTSPKSK